MRILKIILVSSFLLILCFNTSNADNRNKFDNYIDLLQQGYSISETEKILSEIFAEAGFSEKEIKKYFKEQKYKWYSSLLEKNLPYAKKGDIESQYLVGKAYFDLEDFPSALEWFLKAAKSGHADSQYSVALLYFYGLGIPKNYNKSYIWASIANAGGAKRAAPLMEDLQRLMSNEDIIKAQKETEKVWTTIKRK